MPARAHAPTHLVQKLNSADTTGYLSPADKAFLWEITAAEMMTFRRKAQDLVVSHVNGI